MLLVTFVYLLSLSFLLLAYRFLLTDSCLSTLACRLLLDDSCLPTLACRLLLVDPCLSTVSCLLLATNTKLSPCYRCLACYLLQMRQPSCLLTCCKVLLVSCFEKAPLAMFLAAACCCVLVAFFSSPTVIKKLAACFRLSLPDYIRCNRPFLALHTSGMRPVALIPRVDSAPFNPTTQPC
ncbi:hypothetical protein Tco_0381361 [Tanacetum coccineum]